jgi:hypothetical protein
MYTDSTYTQTDITDITDIYDGEDLSVDSCCCGPVEYEQPTWGGEDEYGYTPEPSIWLDPAPEVVAPAATYALVPTEAVAVIPAGQPGGFEAPAVDSTELGGWTGDGFSALASTPAVESTELGGWTGDGFSALASTPATDPDAPFGATWQNLVANGGPTFPPTEMTISSTPSPMAQVYAMAAAQGDIMSQIAAVKIMDSQAWTASLWTL